MRFLFDWQGLVGSDKREGPAALELVLAQLEGFPVAASAWESEILPVRTHWYEAHWLDQLCASGRVIWQRPPGGTDSARKNAPVRATPIVLLPREFAGRSEEHTSELQSLMRISYAVFCLKKKKSTTTLNTKSIMQPTTHTKRSTKSEKLTTSVLTM